VFADGHHIDMPIYYKKENVIELAHRTKDWISSDPKAFYEWFNEKKNTQLERIVSYIKGWKDFREFNNSSLSLPSGFEFTILAVNNYVEDDSDEVAFRETIRAINTELNKPNGFKCLRPTTPIDEDVFAGYSETKKTNFLNALSSLLSELDRADNEKNFKKSSEILRKNVFGERFPLGEDNDEMKKSESLSKSITTSLITPKPYGY
jgi:hypothetical protein